jgi:hypothetical protein
MKPRFRVGILIETPAIFAPSNRNVKLTKSHAQLDKENSTVTCYFRHLKQVFEKAGIEVTSANKRELDRIVHNIVSVNYKNCPDTWRQVKSLILEDEANFASMLKDAWENRKT